MHFAFRLHCKLEEGREGVGRVRGREGVREGITYRGR